MVGVGKYSFFGLLNVSDIVGEREWNIKSKREVSGVEKELWWCCGSRF